MDMDVLIFQKFVMWAFTGLLAGLVVYIINIIIKLTDHVHSLSSSVATLAERTEWLTKHIDSCNKIPAMQVKSFKRSDNGLPKRNSRGSSRDSGTSKGASLRS